LRQYVESSLQVPGFRITWSSHEAVVSPDGQSAYLLGNNAVTMNGPDGVPVTTKGRAVTIWRRGADGEWRCAVDIWNAEPPA
jgi:ketosteroid isomerase-like protein